MSKRILIVDDEPECTMIVRLALERTHQYTVREVNDSSTAIQQAREFQPELIILDIMMPAPDGSELAAELRQDKDLKSVPILFLTALVTKGEVSDPAYGMKQQRYLPKPIDLDKLVLCVDEEISRASVAVANPQ